MKILVSTSVILIASALSMPSVACDRHGGGMFGQLDGASWTEYNPAASESDALLMEQQLSEWHKQNAVQPAKAQPKKPSFSKVSLRASTAAKARLAAQAKLTERDSKSVTTSVNSESSSAAAILNVGR